MSSSVPWVYKDPRQKTNTVEEKHIPTTSLKLHHLLCSITGKFFLNFSWEYCSNVVANIDLSDYLALLNIITLTFFIKWFVNSFYLGPICRDILREDEINFETFHHSQLVSLPSYDLELLTIERNSYCALSK